MAETDPMPPVEKSIMLMPVIIDLCQHPDDSVWTKNDRHAQKRDLLRQFVFDYASDSLNVGGCKLTLSALPQANRSRTLANPSPKLNLRQSRHFAESGPFFHLVLPRSFPRHADERIQSYKYRQSEEKFNYV